MVRAPSRRIKPQPRRQLLSVQTDQKPHRSRGVASAIAPNGRGGRAYVGTGLSGRRVGEGSTPPPRSRQPGSPSPGATRSTGPYPRAHTYPWRMGVEGSRGVDGGTLVPRLVFVPTGTHLSDSATTAGAAAGLLHADSTNKLIGPARSFPLEAGEASEAQASRSAARVASARRASSTSQELGRVAANAALNAAVGVIMELVVIPAASRGIAEAGKRIQKRRRTQGDASPTLIAASSSTEVDGTADDAPVEVSAAEYRDRLLRMLIAESIATSERDFLAKAAVSEDGFDPRLGRALKLVQAGDWSELNDAELDLVRAYLEGARTSDGQYELLRVERVELPPSE